jgi:hypothetical protein
MMSLPFVATLRALPVTMLAFLLQLTFAAPLALPTSLELSRVFTGSWSGPSQAALFDTLTASGPLFRVLGVQSALALAIWMVVSPLLTMAWLSALSAPMGPGRALSQGVRLYLRAVSVTLFILLCALFVLGPWPLLAYGFSHWIDASTDVRAHDVAVLVSLAPLLPLGLAVHSWHDLARARSLELGFLRSVTRSAGDAFSASVLLRALLLGLSGTLLVVGAVWCVGGDSDSAFSPIFAALLVHGAVLAKYYLRSLWLAHTLVCAERRRAPERSA